MIAFRFSKLALNLFLAGSILSMISGCTGLPSQGPIVAQIDLKSEASANTAGFVLIDVNREVTDYLKNKSIPSMNARFGKGHPSRSDSIGIGDVLEIRIWEADEGGLFSSTGIVNRGALPAAVVDSGGMIQVPYVGAVRAAGRSPRTLAKVITSRLAKKTVEPQVSVTKSRNISKTVTVSGAVGKPGIYPLTLRGDDLVDAIAAAGGAKFPGYETQVTLTRNGKTATSYLSHVLETPSDNIYLRKDDQLYLERKPMTFTAFGAVDKKGLHEFRANKLNVLQGVARVSGLNDNRADPGGVFLMRFEQAKTAYALAGTASSNNSNSGKRSIPVIYRFDFKDPNQYFFAKVIDLRPEDVIYVADAPSVEVDKFLSILGKAVGIGIATSNLKNRL